jgi:hypothetical protein
MHRAFILRRKPERPWNNRPSRYCFLMSWSREQLDRYGLRQAAFRTRIDSSRPSRASLLALALVRRGGARSEIRVRGRPHGRALTRPFLGMLQLQRCRASSNEPPSVGRRAQPARAPGRSSSESRLGLAQMRSTAWRPAGVGCGRRTE